eukprot:2075343-Amphidinium_carterae.1
MSQQGYDSHVLTRVQLTLCPSKSDWVDTPRQCLSASLTCSILKFAASNMLYASSTLQLMDFTAITIMSVLKRNSRKQESEQQGYV